MEKKIKIITLGESGVGKTSIIQRICKKEFHEDMASTIGFQYEEITKEYTKKNIIMKLSFIDTAGQEQYSELPKMYLRGCHIVLLVFSDLISLETIKNRLYDIYIDSANIEYSKFILVGNKSDTFGENKDKIKEEGMKFAENIDAFFLTCSAKSEDNIDNLENIIVTEAKRIIDEEEKARKFINGSIGNDSAENDIFMMRFNSREEKSRSNGCNC